MIVNFNINDFIYVKLKPVGIAELEKQHRDLLKTFPGMGDFEYPEEDADGYSKWQMHQLMSTFGQLFSTGLPEPFNLNIKVDVQDRVKIGTYYLEVEALQYFNLPKGSKIIEVVIVDRDTFRIGLNYTNPELDGFEQYKARLIWAAENITLGGTWSCVGSVDIYGTKLYVYCSKV